jgi:NADH-quinone oxidoreductase subunit L
MFSFETLMLLIPGLPLLATVIIALFGKTVLKERSHLPIAIALAGSFVFSAMLLSRVCDHAEASAAAPANKATGKQVGYERVFNVWTWAVVDGAYSQAEAKKVDGREPVAPRVPSVSDFRIDITLRADPLTCTMLCMVTFISTLVVIYASGYMHGDPGYWRFFTYVSLFVFSMTMLVSVSNFVLLYVFWEAVGLCSYLLVGFWYEKPEAVAAGKKAFLVNRIGDFGFALGIFLIWTTFGTLNFHDTLNADGSLAVAGVLGQTRLADPALYNIGGGVALLIALGLMTGACGKSAQFPLHVWLPDAMEGPTPVSALIHAATMVTAGVYMVTRCTPLFSLSTDAQAVVAVIGGFTALLAGLIALTQNDLKRVLAYSTVSQLGYMFLSLGTGSLAGIVAGMFHLFTHAFFKALLFLGAGSVMHAMGHIIDMRRFSGLRHLMPWTFRTFWIGSLALAGIVPFSGFWSKDAILAAVHERAHHDTLYLVLYWSAVFTAFLTAFYTFRGLFMTFYGPTRVPEEAGHHAHESPPAMTFPLIVLSIGAACVGGYFEWTHGFAEFLVRTPSLAFGPVFGDGLGHGFHMDIAAFSTVVALAGAGLAAYFYLGERREVNILTELMQNKFGLNLYRLSYNKFYIDEIYYALFVLPVLGLAAFCDFIDRWVIDGTVNLGGIIPRAVGSLLRTLQAGLVQFYALAMVLGVLVLIGTLLLWQVS